MALLIPGLLQGLTTVSAVDAPLPASGIEAREDLRAGNGEVVLRGAIVGRANPTRVVDATLTVPGKPLRPGQAATLSLTLEIKPGWHVNSSRPTLEYLIPTRVEFSDNDAISVEDVAYPEGLLVSLKFADEDLSVYEGRTIIRPTIRAGTGRPAGTYEIRARLTYQACNDVSCLAPEVVEFLMPLRVRGEPVDPGVPPLAGGDAGVPGERAGAASKSDGGLEALLAERGLLFVLGVVFVAGLALNLTPCVYPMIPITIGFFSGQSASGGWGRRALLPGLYVLGMALTYSTLGVVAGLSGGLFGASLQSPWVVGTLVALLVVMAFWMFGAYELRMPGALTSRMGRGRTGGLGAVVMGLTMGVVAAPCIGPFVVTLLAFISASGDPILGFVLFFVLAIGLGVPFLALGMFSGSIANLPRSGAWLIYVKKIMGVALLGVAIYFLQPFLSDRQIGVMTLSFALAAGIYLGWLERSRMRGRWFVPLKVTTGLMIVLVGAWLSLPLVRARPEAAWETYSAENLQRAAAAGRPTVIDFFADWCLPCKELDRNTFSDPAVLEELERFALFKADLTSFESEPVRELRERFDVLGVPTIVFIDGRGEEQVELRLYGFEPPRSFLDRLRQVR